MPIEPLVRGAGQSTRINSWHCPHCGSPQVVGARVCLDCGCVPRDELRGAATLLPLTVAALAMLSVFAAFWFADG